MEDLADIDEVGRRRGPGDEHARDPGDRELGSVERRTRDLRRAVRAALEERDVEAFRFEVPLLDRRDVARELGAERPAQLDAHRRQALIAGPGAWRRRAS